jgi:serine/threonine-protein kinase mTOR
MSADSCPAVFNVHVRQFVVLIWSGLRDPKLDIRSAAVAALRACLILVEKRETRYRVQWWYNLFEQTMRGLVRPWLKASERDIEANVHASLLTLGELLQHSGEFMLARCGSAFGLLACVQTNAEHNW